MKKVIVSTIVIFVFVSGCLVFLKSKVREKSSDQIQIEQMLKSFYTEYIKVNAAEKLDLVKGDSLKRKYCTKQFLDRIKQDTELDYDPLVNAQDYSNDWLNTMTIEKIDGKHNNYKVCFIYNYDNSLHCVIVNVVKQSGVWKIDGTKE